MDSNDTPASRDLTMQQMAKRSGASAHTLRYDERVGLLGEVTG